MLKLPTHSDSGFHDLFLKQANKQKITLKTEDSTNLKLPEGYPHHCYCRQSS
jgi:hypothetical protein